MSYLAELFSDVVSPALRDYLLAETRLKGVRAASSLLVPGLLQTEAYALALLLPSHGEMMARGLAALRPARREVLWGRSQALVRVVFGDVALTSAPNDDVEALREQLEYLASGRTFPYRVYELTRHTTCFNWRDFTIAGDRVFLEGDTAADDVIRVTTESLARYEEWWEKLWDSSLNEADSVELVRERLARLKAEPAPVLT